MTLDKKTRNTAAEGSVAFQSRENVYIGVFDGNAEFRSKKVSSAKFEKLKKDGYPVCNVLYNWDATETPYCGGSFIDHPAELDAASVRTYPFDTRDQVCIADFIGEFGERTPRNQLRKQLAKAANMGFSVHSAFEFEFMILDETPDSIREKGYLNLNHFAKANRTYSMQSSALYNDLLEGFEDCLRTADIQIDAIHSELGPGCFEVPLAHAEGMKAADDAALFKTFTKAFFLRNQKMATFLSKLSEDFAGQSGHLHLSLRNLKDGSPVFSDIDDENGLSDMAHYFVGGVLHMLPQAIGLCSHTVNAYKRLVPGTWAPTHAGWGVQNRTAALRAINDDPQSTRIEFRVPSADANPYGALAFLLGAGLWGIENKIDPGEPSTEDLYAITPDASAIFPTTLREANTRLQNSETAREIFGDTYVDSVIEAQSFEISAFEKHVSEWELRRYIEVF